ncbi:hypothetical protein V1477_010830, partial [Vespula maculifrons]
MGLGRWGGLSSHALALNGPSILTLDFRTEVELLTNFNGYKEKRKKRKDKEKRRIEKEQQQKRKQKIKRSSPVEITKLSSGMKS